MDSLTVYITSQGDMWDALCAKLCGSSNYMPLMFWKNRATLCADGELAIHKILLPAGVQIVVPSSEELDENIPAAYAEYLPPWSEV